MSRPIPVDFPLPPSSTLFDLGAYRGDWTRAMAAAHPEAWIYSFEPVQAFLKDLSVNAPPNVRCLPFGLAPRTCSAEMRLSADGSSLVHGDPSFSREIVQLVEIGEFLAREAIPRVDLLKMNIEGSEFDLLDHMLAIGLLPRVGTLLIQFHSFAVEDAASRFQRIAEGLSRTHHQEGDPWVWGIWRPLEPEPAP